MSHLNSRDIIRAWKDPRYRKTLSEQDLASFPAHPAGTIELPEELTATVTGGANFVGGKLVGSWGGGNCKAISLAMSSTVNCCYKTK